MKRSRRIRQLADHYRHLHKRLSTSPLSGKYHWHYTKAAIKAIGWALNQLAPNDKIVQSLPKFEDALTVQKQMLESNGVQVEGLREVHLILKGAKLRLYALGMDELAEDLEEVMQQVQEREKAISGLKAIEEKSK